MSNSPLSKFADIYYGKSPNGFRSDSETNYQMFGTGGVVGYATKPIFESDGVVIPRKGSLNNPSHAMGKYWVIDTAYAALPKQGFDAKWLYYQLLNYDLSRLNEATGVPSISRDWLYKVEFFESGLKEQQKIAQILSSIDEQIELTEKLIEKMELERDGLAQDLLAGGQNWLELKLESLAEVVSGGTPSRAVPAYWGNDYPWVTPTDITTSRGNFLNSTKEMISELGLQNSSAKLLPTGTVLMTSRATLGESKIALFPVCTNQGFKSLIPKQGIDSAFLMYQMRRMRNLYSNLGIGTTFLEVNKRDTGNFLIPIPATESEQKRISSIMLLIDEEIDSEYAILGKLKLKKQGLMQDLLTGQVRVS